MRSRYSFMKASTYRDIDGNFFPNPASVNFNNLQASKTTPIELTEYSCEKFWIVPHNLYNVFEFDDVLLSINKIPHKNFLKPGDVLIAPRLEDIEVSFSEEN